MSIPKKRKSPKTGIREPILKAASILKYGKVSKVEETSEKKLKMLQNWLLSGRKITARQCSRMWGYDRCADGIFKLRRVMNIETVLVFGKDRFLKPVRYAVYKYLGQRPSIRKDDRLTATSSETTYKFTHRFMMKPAELKKHIAEYVEKQLRTPVNSIKMPTKKRNYVFVSSGLGPLIFNIIQK